MLINFLSLVTAMNYSAGGWWTSAKINTNVNEMINKSAASHEEETAGCGQSEVISVVCIAKLEKRNNSLLEMPGSPSSLPATVTFALRLSGALQADWRTSKEVRRWFLLSQKRR